MEQGNFLAEQGIKIEEQGFSWWIREMPHDSVARLSDGADHIKPASLFSFVAVSP